MYEMHLTNTIIFLLDTLAFSILFATTFAIFTRRTNGCECDRLGARLRSWIKMLVLWPVLHGALGRCTKQTREALAVRTTKSLQQVCKLKKNNKYTKITVFSRLSLLFYEFKQYFQTRKCVSKFMGYSHFKEAWQCWLLQKCCNLISP